MSKELAKAYEPQEVEGRIYDFWMQGGYFHAEVDPKKKPYTIVIPPPNITGQLHMGHAWDETLQDILIRWKRMQGYSALWLPGTDHASIATEAKIVEAMREEGLSKEDLGREAFLERAWAWKDKFGGRILEQLKLLGSSCDWDRLRFTMDEGCSKAVRHVFVKLYEEGLIYRGERIINWCPHCKTAISDAEVIFEEQQGSFWHLRYPLADGSGYIQLATTRPETMLGDTAVAVHPEDERYKHLVGKNVILPLVNKEIPIVADEYVEMDFGTGVVKITPAHEPNDFEVGQRHNLPIVRVFTYDGHMTGAKEKAENDALFASGKATVGEPRVIDCGKYAGMTTMEARKAIVKDLEAGGYLKRVEPLAHEVGTCYRCHTTIEPMVSKQWFVKMAPLAKPAVECVRSGEVRFVPERFAKNYMTWMENIRDWCISRQLWWGHRIPAYYCPDCGEMVVAKSAPQKCPKCGCGHMEQDPDTLDTWFSSALWPFSTLGWPKKTEDLDYFFPTDVLVTGYDIIFFWVIRMIFSGYEQMGKAPFHTVLFHGLVRDSQGRKMSKSLGNGIDPLEVIDKYGADALRLTLITGNAPGNDMRFYWERVESSRNFANKVWNASRFIMMNLEGAAITEPSADELQPADKWILSKVNTLAKDVTENMDKYEMGIAVQKVYDFIWDEFCDWYIEITKTRTYNKEQDPVSANAAFWTLKTALTEALKLLHPFMPFITEEIFCTLHPKEETIMLAKWPEYRADWNFPAEEEMLEHCKDLVKGVRNVRTEMDVPPSRKAKIFIVADDAALRETFEKTREAYQNLAGASDVSVQADKNGIEDDAVSVVIPRATLYLPLEDLVDFEKEKERLLKEKERLVKELARSRGMLSNEKFLSKAPEAKVQEEKEKLAGYEQMMAQVEERLAQMNR